MRAIHWYLAAALLAVPIPTLAVNPLDNDGGSGGDAGDVPQLATPTALGRIEGSLAFPADRVDYYTFEAEAGDTLTIASDGLTARASLVWIGNDGERTYGWSYPAPYAATNLIPFDGTWFIKVEPYTMGPVDYRLQADLGHAAHWAIVESTQGATMEVAWQEAATLRSSSLAVNGGNGPWAVSWTRDLEGWGGGTGGCIAGGSDALVAVSGPIPGQRVDNPLADVDTVTGAGWCASSGTSGHASAGAAKFTTFASGPGYVYQGITSDVPIEVRAASASDFTVLTDSGSAAAKVIAPGVSIVGERDLSFDVQGYFAGFAYAPDHPNAILEAPDGSQTPFHYGWASLAGAEHGRWHLRLDAQTTVGGPQYDVRFVGGHAPLLGLFDPSVPDHPHG